MEKLILNVNDVRLAHYKTNITRHHQLQNEQLDYGEGASVMVLAVYVYFYVPP